MTPRAPRLLAALGVPLLAIVAYALTRGGAGPAPVAPVRVFAASSLADALPRAGADWTARGNATVRFAFDASSRLARQIEAGAPADVFFSADTEWMEYLQSRGRIDSATRVNLLGNALVMAVPARSTFPLASAEDLATRQPSRLALAGESVPAGRYARAALGALGVWDAVEASVVRGDNVRTVLGWVARGEAEAGVVYATDARGAPGVKVAFTFPPTSHPPILYPMAVVRGAERASEATAFLAFCASPDGMAAFRGSGFTAAAGSP